MTKELTEVVTVRFPKSIVDALKQHQIAVGIPPSEFIRRAVVDKLQKVEIETPCQKIG
jgi:predicted DNA binding CopG/RHH family protein